MNTISRLAIATLSFGALVIGYFLFFSPQKPIGGLGEQQSQASAIGGAKDALGGANPIDERSGTSSLTTTNKDFAAKFDPTRLRFNASIQTRIPGVANLTSTTFLFSDALRTLNADQTLTAGARAAGSAMIQTRCWLINEHLAPLQPPTVKNNAADFAVRAERLEFLSNRTKKERCAGIDTSAASEAGVREKWEEAARLGDVRGIAASIDAKLHSPENLTNKKPSGSLDAPTIFKGPTSQETQALLAGLSSKDPDFIMSFGSFFELSFSDVDFLLGDRSEKFPIGVGGMFWEYLACQYGAECGSNHPLVALACVNEGRCALPSFETYLQTVLTKEDWEQFQRLIPQFVQAIETGKWDNVVRRQSPPSGIGPRNYIANPTIITTRG